MAAFGQLVRRGPRAAWDNEPEAFTPWLADNLAALGRALGLDLERVNTEAPVGSFALDLLATDLATGGHVVIENQLSPSDHDHLGKLLTYASGYRAETVVWVAETFRDEHIQALEWLNQRSDARTRFFAVRVEVVQVDDSRPAPDFRVVVAPNDWQKAAGQQRNCEPGPRGQRYAAFFQPLIDELRERYGLTTARTAQPRRNVNFRSGLPGVAYALAFANNRSARVELYLGHSEPERNAALFDALAEQAEAIEAELGEALTWERQDHRGSCRVSLYTDGHIDQDDARLSALRSWARDRLLLFHHVLRPRVRAALDELATG